MPTKRSSTFATLTVVALLSAAWAWHDCMLLATGVAVAFRMYLIHVGTAPEQAALAAGLDRLAGGALLAICGAGLLAGVASIWLGWWAPALQHPALSIALLMPAAAHCCRSRQGSVLRLREAFLWLGVLLAMALAREAEQAGIAIAPCVFVVAVGLVLLCAGWRLASETTTGLLRVSNQSR